MRAARFPVAAAIRRAGWWLVVGVAASLLLLACRGSAVDEAARQPATASPETARPSPTGTTAPVSPTPTTTTPPGQADAVWTTAATTIGGEAFPAVLWTGGKVVVIRTLNGGNDVTGEQWDPATNEATPIAASGLSWRASPAIVWTGSEVLIVGGSSGPALNQIGAAYNPETDTWRTLPDPPGRVDAWEHSLTGQAVWTGSEMILWRAGLAFSPETDSWRRLAPVPLSERNRPITMWTGTDLVVWGGCQADDVQCDESNTGLLADGAMYRPLFDRWDAMSTSPLAPAVHAVAVSTGTEVIVVSTDPADPSASTVAAFNPSSNVWRTLAPLPLSPRRHAAATWTGNRLVVWGGSVGATGDGYDDGASYDHTTDRWALLPPPPLPAEGRSLHSMVNAGDRIYVSTTFGSSRPLQLQLAPVSATADALTTSRPHIAGLLLDGDPWILTLDTDLGLCLVMSGTNYGCDSIGPARANNEQPVVPWVAGVLHPAPGISEDNAGALAYGFLPPEAAAVQLVLPNGDTFETESVIDADAGMWAAAIEPGANPSEVRYLDEAGVLIDPSAD